MARSRTPVRDAREFDTTSLHEGHHGASLHRDYTAHWHRWSFARRMIKVTDHVLEVGCGPEMPLQRMLFRGSFPLAESYVGVDLNKLKPSKHQRSTLYGEFNFCKDYKKIARPAGSAGFDVAVHMEVIEHMKVEHGRALLKGCFELLRPGGLMLMSTPCYDGRRHAANHIHEYTVPELEAATRKAGFVVERRFGTFMDIKNIKKLGEPKSDDQRAIQRVAAMLEDYYDNDALSCIFAPLGPDLARNNLWVCRKPEKK